MNVRDLPEHVTTRLIVSPRDKRVPTRQRSTDATTALTRGLAEYIASLQPVDFEGRYIPIAKVFDSWAEPEDEADYPSIACYTNGNPGQYEAQSMSPLVNPNRYPDGSYEVSSRTLSVDVKVELWATDPEQRQAIIQALEDAFEPVDWMGGFRLELPHYYGQRATFDGAEVTYMGDTLEANQRFVNAVITMHASVPVTRVLPFAQATVKARTVTTSSDLQPPPGVDVAPKT